MAENTQIQKNGGKKTKSAGGFRSTAAGKVLFAFDFGEFSVKIAVLKIRRGSIELRHLVTVENRENLTRLDHSNVREWRTRIQRALSQLNIVVDDHLAVCTVGGKNFISRRLEIPYAEEKDRAGLVENEMSQLLALDSASYVFQHELLEVVGSGENKKCVVWAVAMPREVSGAAYELLRSLKLRPLVMDIHVNGIRRFLKADEALRNGCKGQTVACIDYGMTNTEINYVRGGQLIGNSLVDEGDGRLVSEARNALGVRAADPSNPNKLTASPREICDILNKAHTTAEERSFTMFIQDLLSKIDTAISRFNFEHPSEPVGKIYMYGGSPQLVWLSQYVASVTQLPTEHITKTNLFDTESMANQKNIDYSAYLNVLGLALME